MSRFETDALRPSALPTANLGRPRPLASSSNDINAPNGGSNQAAEGSRKKFFDDWNVRVDKEIKAVAGGLKELVDLADASQIGESPTNLTPSLTALHLPLRTSQLIKATQQLRDTAHELRLMLLLSDEVDTARRRDHEMGILRGEVTKRREEVGREVRLLLGGEEAARLDEEELRPESGVVGMNGHVEEGESNQVNGNTAGPEPTVPEQKEDEAEDDDEDEMEEVA